MTTHALQLCPECGSGKIEMGSLVGEDLEATCQNCGWKGPHRDLIAAPAREEDLGRQSNIIYGTTDFTLGIAEEVSKAYMNLIAQHVARGLGLAMIESGLVGRQQPKELTRLIRAASLGAHAATLKEIEEIQKELQDERRGTNN
jgi:hypothetical protein